MAQPHNTLSSTRFNSLSTLTLVLLISGCQLLPTQTPPDPDSNDNAYEQSASEKEAARLMPLSSQQQSTSRSSPHPRTTMTPTALSQAPTVVTLSPTPDYADDHIIEDLAALFPEEFNDAKAFEWPRQISAYDRDIWHDLRTKFQLNLDIDEPRVAAELSWYSRNQGYFNRVSTRAQRYLPHVYQELVARDLPLELALLPIIESAYDPFAYSHGRASGMWQFIPNTGRYYGLSQDWWYDGRRDVVASTQAAIDFLSELAGQFDGDWELALAAYNSGGGTVRRAQRINRERGLPTDFWSLGLPAETRAYVPKMIALATIIADPQAHGIELPTMANKPYFERIDVNGQIDLAQAARMADISLEELYLLNPGYNQWATHPDGPQYLLIPMHRAERFRTQLAATPADQRVRWSRYQIRPGDSLITIARAHQTTVEVLQDVNDIRSSIIRAGSHLLIPTASAQSVVYSMSADNRQDQRQSRQPKNGLERLDHVVRSGDSFWDLARQYDVNLRQLARWNSKAPTDPIIVGETLVIWTTPDRVAASSSSSPASRSVVRRVGYTVRNGDNLSAIANRFNVSVADIQRWNSSSLSGRYIQPGLRLDLYVNVTNGPSN
ncbi:MAG: LysM peptidoglycan-binding domain-containing protein [Natronospirillum sp.]